MELMYQELNHHVSVSYLPVTQNVLAGTVSRHFAIAQKWELHDSVVNRIFAQWRIPNLDLFTSQANKKCNMNCSR